MAFTCVFSGGVSFCWGSWQKCNTVRETTEWTAIPAGEVVKFEGRAGRHGSGMLR